VEVLIRQKIALGKMLEIVVNPATNRMVIYLIQQHVDLL